MQVDSVTVLTLTGSRPEAFRLCERWMSRQTFGRFQWVVVDDGREPAKCTMGQEYHHRPDLNSLPLKVAHAVDEGWVKGSILAIVEDDDYYAPDYLERGIYELDGHWAAGECPAIYYHVGYRMWRDMNNHDHASFCQTVIRREAFPLLLDACEIAHAARDGWVDLRFWARTPQGRGRLFAPDDHRTLIGIKGMPGRPGYGWGHRPPELDTWNPDPDLSWLRNEIGFDAKAYAPFQLR